MIPLTPSFLIAAAAGLVGLSEEHSSDGVQMIELFRRGVNQPAGEPWSAAFVHHVGYWSHFEYGAGRSSWPLPATSSWKALAEYAEEHEVLLEEPADGDVFLLWHAPTACFAHTGVVARVRGGGVTPGGTSWFDCETIEGDNGGEHRGDGAVAKSVVRRERRFYPDMGDRFIRWADLDRRWLWGDPREASVKVA